MPTTITDQFRYTTCRLILDVTRGLGRSLGDANWIGGFCLPMIGSLGHECLGFSVMEEMKPTVQGSLGGISFAQWTGVRITNPVGRREQFMRHCRSKHLHPYSYDAAVSFIIYELTTTARNVVNATLNAPPADAAPYGIRGNVDPALLGRVIKFEKLYENAGVKHYASRYAYAVMARDVYRDWALKGFPVPGQFVMPHSRFSVQFDKEFGTGESETTARWDGHVATLGRVLDSIDQNAPPPAPPMIRKRVYAEARLSPAAIVAVQKRLRQLGFVGVGEANGVWGTSTIGAISALQAEAGIDVDGHYGPDTRKALADGVQHRVSEARATVTSSELLKAGEPTLQAVQPANITSKLTAGLATAGAAVSGITSAWPDASTTVDTIKGYFADVPGWVWFAAIAVIALYLYLSTRAVKQSVTSGYRQGSVKTLEAPVRQAEDPGALVPLVPPEPEHEDPPYNRDVDSVRGGDDRPLGVE